MGRVSVVPNTTLLGKYRIEEVLGRGGMGVVVRGRHISLDEVVAIKVLGEDVAVTTELFTRFMREAKAAAKLKSKHVARVNDVGRLEDGSPYMVMELLEGRDLAQVIKDGALGPAFAAKVVIQTCEVLAEAHAMGIVHRDIKPSNLFVTTDGDGDAFVKVLDFGIAKAPDLSTAPITSTFSMLGTPGYMSPEQLRSSRTVDHRTDLWSLGVVLYEALEGRRPFEANDLPELIMQIAIEPTKPLVRTTGELAAIVMCCLEKEPDKRFQNATELAQALTPYLGDAGQARARIERINRLVKAVGERAEPPTPPPRGRLDEPTAGPHSAGMLSTTPAKGQAPAVTTPDRPKRLSAEPVQHAESVKRAEPSKRVLEQLAGRITAPAFAQDAIDPHAHSAVATLPRTEPPKRRRWLLPMLLVGVVAIGGAVTFAVAQKSLQSDTVEQVTPPVVETPKPTAPGIDTPRPPPTQAKLNDPPVPADKPADTTPTASSDKPAADKPADDKPVAKPPKQQPHRHRVDAKPLKPVDTAIKPADKPAEPPPDAAKPAAHDIEPPKPPPKPTDWMEPK